MSIQSLTSTHVVTHYPKTITAGAAGGPIRADGTASTKRCRIQPLNSRQRTDLGQVGFRTTHVLYFSSDPGVDEHDRFEYVDQDGATHKLWAVSDATNTDYLNRLWQVECEERKDGD